MNKSNLKSFISGIIVATIGITTVFAAGGIKSAQFNSNKVIFNGKDLDLKGSQMISVVKDGEQNASNYMPVKAVLESMGYSVTWDGSKGAVIVSDKESVTIQAEQMSQVSESFISFRELAVKYELDLDSDNNLCKNGAIIVNVKNISNVITEGITYIDEAEFLKLYHAAGF